MSQVVVWKAVARLPAINWRTKPSRRSLAVVRERWGPAAATALTHHARVEWRTAREVLSDARRAPLPMDDPDVQRHAERVKSGRLLHPVVTDGRTLVDGEHRTSLAYHRNPNERVPVLEVRAESDEPKMSKKKLKKSAQRPSDVDGWKVYSTPGAAIDQAVAGAYDRPDDEELNAEAAEIKRQNPGLSGFAAYERAARGSGATVRKSAIRAAEDSVGQLGESLGHLDREARRAGLNAQQRYILNKASRDAQLRYLRAMRPWAVENDIAKADADGGRLVAKAETIRKADPNVSEYESLRRAARRTAA